MSSSISLPIAVIDIEVSDTVASTFSAVTITSSICLRSSSALACNAKQASRKVKGSDAHLLWFMILP